MDELLHEAEIFFLVNDIRRTGYTSIGELAMLAKLSITAWYDREEALEGLVEIDPVTGLLVALVSVCAPDAAKRWFATDVLVRRYGVELSFAPWDVFKMDRWEAARAISVAGIGDGRLPKECGENTSAVVSFAERLRHALFGDTKRGRAIAWDLCFEQQADKPDLRLVASVMATSSPHHEVLLAGLHLLRTLDFALYINLQSSHFYGLYRDS